MRSRGSMRSSIDLRQTFGPWAGHLSVLLLVTFAVYFVLERGGFDYAQWAARNRVEEERIYRTFGIMTKRLFFKDI